MKKDWKYILYLGAAIAAYLIIAMMAPRQLDWRVTFHREHKIPFGGYALHTLLPDVFPGKKIDQNNFTLYELYDSIKRPVNFISISDGFSPPKDDVNALLKNIASGGAAFISANSFYGPFADTLHIGTEDYFFDDEHRHFLTENTNDTSTLRFVNASLDVKGQFRYPRKNIHQRFKFTSDSLQATVMSRNDVGLPVTLSIQWGKGLIILNCSPMAFTNAYILPGDNHAFASTTLSHLPQRDILWTEYYQLGRMEAQTPLRFILTNDALRWAYFITILSLLVFMVFEAKRKQRIIPVIKPLQNTSVEFVKTIGNLYFQQGEHKDLAEKKISFLFDYIRTRHWLNTSKTDDLFITALAKKSAKPEEDIRTLILVIKSIQAQPAITIQQLTDLNQRIEKFYEQPVVPSRQH